ncbi:MAG: alpha/beta hydrolase [Acidimicrobiales bacterium]
MPQAASNGIELEYETFGASGDPPLLLVMGLGAQMISWDDELCEAFADRGFFVIRFDNRDVGLSTKIDAPDADVLAAATAAMAGQPVDAPYLLSDMAADAWGLLDALDIDRAHLIGASMGGMIVQSMAIARPDRVMSLTSIMSTTGDPDVGMPHPDVLHVLMEPAPVEREAYIEQSVRNSRAIGSPEHFEEERARRKAARSYDRCFHPKGVTNQLLAILASGSRSAALRELRLPALVIHGDADPLVDVSGGERTAECLAGSELLILEGMGHDLPTHYWARIVEGVCSLASRAGVET